MKNKIITKFYMSLGLSTYSNHFGSILLSWFIYDITGSKLAMGTLWLSIVIGQIIAQFLIGPYLDIWKRKNVMLFSELYRGIIFIIILFLFLSGNLNEIHIFIFSFLLTIQFYEPAANALIPDLVSNHQLVDVNSRATSIVQFMRILGTASVGLVALIGGANSIYIIIGLIILSTAMIISISEESKQLTERASWLTQFKKGAVIYKDKPVLIYLGVFIAVANFSIFASQTMYLPFVMENLDGNSFTYGLFMASWPIGYILGANLLRKIPEIKLNLRVKVMVGGLIAGAVTFIMLGFTENIYLAILIEIIAGISGPFWNVHSTYLYQVIVPKEIRAQVFSVRTLIARVFAPIGIIFGTFTSVAIGIPSMFITVGILSMIIILIGFHFMNSHLRKNEYI